MPRWADPYHEPDPAEDLPWLRRRRHADRLVCLLGLGLGLSGLAATRLGQLWTAFDVVSNFTLQFVVVTTAFLAGLLMPRGKLLTANILLVLGITAIGMWPHLASQADIKPATAATGERAMRVASFNTLWTNNNVEALKAEIMRLDADLILLIEMNAMKRAMLAQLRGLYPHQASCQSEELCKFAVLSKLPIAESEAVGRWQGPRYIRVKLGPEAGGLSVFGIHTTRFPYWQAQVRQMTAMAGIIETTGGHRLVMGDFNATPYSRLLSTFADRTGLTRLTYLPSWPAQLGLPQLAIDHILVSREIRPLTPARIGEAAGSDHYPVSMAIAVPLNP